MRVMIVRERCRRIEKSLAPWGDLETRSLFITPRSASYARRSSLGTSASVERPLQLLSGFYGIGVCRASS